jgi:hypothetical protein
MGFFDSIFGGDSPEVKFEQSAQQRQLGGSITPFLQSLFSPNAWQNLLPTTEIMNSLDPSISNALWQPIHQGADQLQERLIGSGIVGGSAGNALGSYYGQAAPQVSGQLANLVSPALSYPYSMAGSLFGQTLPTPVVDPGSPGILPGLIQAAAPIAGMAMFGPFGAAAGGGGGGFLDLAGGTSRWANMGAPMSYNQTWQPRL